MKYLSSVFFLILVCSTSCDNREQKLRKKELELAQKEQELLLKEKELQLREQQLLKETASAEDSIVIDSIGQNTALIGKWAAKMVCTETDCEGSAIGDTKIEEWEISYQGTTILAKAMANNKLARVYSGKQVGRIFELIAENNAAEATPPTKIAVKLKLTSAKKLEGQREIFREGCRIIYSLELNKQ